MSSKAARLRRRHEARRKEFKRLRKSGLVPQHTRAERGRAAAERQLQGIAERSRQAWVRRGAFQVAMWTGMASLAFFPSAVSSGYHLYPNVSATRMAWPDHTDLPHPAEQDMTFDTPYGGPGTARTDTVLGPVDPVSWDGSERYGWFGPNIRGD